MNNVVPLPNAWNRVNSAIINAVAPSPVEFDLDDELLNMRSSRAMFEHMVSNLVAQASSIGWYKKPNNEIKVTTKELKYSCIMILDRPHDTEVERTNGASIANDYGYKGFNQEEFLAVFHFNSELDHLNMIYDMLDDNGIEYDVQDIELTEGDMLLQFTFPIVQFFN